MALHRHRSYCCIPSQGRSMPAWTPPARVSGTKLPTRSEVVKACYFVIFSTNQVIFPSCRSIFYIHETVTIIITYGNFNFNVQ